MALTPWKPGQSGNPAGRPKSKPFKDALLKAIQELGLEGAAKALVAKANEGDVGALRELADRLDGKVPQAIGGTDELPAIKGIGWLEPTALSESTTDPANNSSRSTSEASDGLASWPTEGQAKQ